MPVDLKSLRTVIGVATTRRDDAGAALASARQQLAAAEAQMAQLTDYVDQGQVKWAGRAAQGVTPVLMQHQRHFMDKIQAAIDFQANVIQQRNAQVTRAMQALQAAEQALAKIEKVQQITIDSIALKAKKTEQKLTDEMAMSMLAHQRRQAATETQP
ncbi:MAG: flagellar export protein FliJ [Burkholderiaceae bacterium]